MLSGGTTETTDEIDAQKLELDFAMLDAVEYIPVDEPGDVK